MEGSCRKSKRPHGSWNNIEIPKTVTLIVSLPISYNMTTSSSVSFRENEYKTQLINEIFITALGTSPRDT